MRLAEAVGIVSVHAAAYRRNALVAVAVACGQVYAMLPESGPAPSETQEESLAGWAADLVTALRRHTGTPDGAERRDRRPARQGCGDAVPRKRMWGRPSGSGWVTVARTP
ncbi:hypothetical protein SNE510_28300 [Streptomyces sp. NE5-10]|uniref:hypothetical protein n=1 Tax=Streptomyces sp. NE5-10 TaxID=2759674 RepID=UPI0019044CBA|nr:hypothetical protein [Streptomyces sp. NE5-10]GHJ93311.1 hypothetical protein SNE510_28300 [Streptomyces sp. NE5-10]